MTHSGKFIALLLVVLFYGVSAQAGGMTVTSVADSGPGSLRAALAASQDGDNIEFQLLGCPCTIFLNSGFSVVDKTLSIVGPGIETLTLHLSGNDTSFFNYQSTISGKTLSLSGMTLTQAAGWAIQAPANDAASLSVADVALHDNGGGILLWGDKLNLVRSTVSSSTDASLSAGVFFRGSNLEIFDSTVSGNAAEGVEILASGAEQSFAALTNVTISGNMGSNVGGMSVFAFNGAEVDLSLNNVTITDNRGVGGAAEVGGIDLTEVSGGSIEARLNNSLLAGNSTPNNPGGVEDCNAPAGTLISNGFNLVESPTNCNGLQVGSDILQVSPLLGALQDNGGPTFTHALLTGSPAIDAGDPNGCRDGKGDVLATDQRGEPRPVNGRCDIGAYEAASDSGDNNDDGEPEGDNDEASRDGGGCALHGKNGGAHAAWAIFLVLAGLGISLRLSGALRSR